MNTQAPPRPPRISPWLLVPVYRRPRRHLSGGGCHILLRQRLHRIVRHGPVSRTAPAHRRSPGSNRPAVPDPTGIAPRHSAVPVPLGVGDPSRLAEAVCAALGSDRDRSGDHGTWIHRGCALHPLRVRGHLRRLARDHPDARLLLALPPLAWRGTNSGRPGGRTRSDAQSDSPGRSS